MSTFVVATIIIAVLWLVTGSLALLAIRRLRLIRRRTDRSEAGPVQNGLTARSSVPSAVPRSRPDDPHT